MSDYDPQNVFARILRGELPAERVFEDDHTLAIMDIMPRTDGHCLVLPKAAARTFADLPAAAIGPVFASVQRLMHAARIGMGADGATIQQFNEAAGGQVVFHMHVHVLPRWDGVSLRPHTGAMAESATLAAHAGRIRAALGAA